MLSLPPMPIHPPHTLAPEIVYVFRQEIQPHVTVPIHWSSYDLKGQLLYGEIVVMGTGWDLLRYLDENGMSADISHFKVIWTTPAWETIYRACNT